ncbi:MAG: soluble lytic murein transglycosylase [Myxococcota bacterium]|jgi:soluble lytic murein transglycosylase
MLPIVRFLLPIGLALALLSCNDMDPLPMELTAPPERADRTHKKTTIHEIKTQPGLSPAPNAAKAPASNTPKAAASNPPDGGTRSEPAERPPEAEAAVVPLIAPALTAWFVGSEAHEAFGNKRWSDAAREFTAEAERVGETPTKARAELMAAISMLRDGHPKEAAHRLERAIGRIESIESHVKLLAAEAWSRAQKPSKALKHLNTLHGSGFAEARRVSLLRARALKNLGQKENAAKAFTAHLAAYGASSSVRLEAASAYRALGSAGTEREAKTLRSVLARSPNSSSAREADARLKTLPKKLRRLTRSELLTRLDAQYDSQRHAAALKTAALLRKRTKTGSRIWCKAGYVEARTLEKAKKRAKALTAWEDLVTECEKKSNVSVEMYYGAARRHASSGSRAKAVTYFNKVEVVAPKHSYVDDAWIRGAELLRDRGKHAAADKLLLKAQNGSGDMQEKAAWELFWHHYQAGRVTRALELLESGIENVDKAQIRLRRGRLVYWHARALQRLKKPKRAAAGYARVIREFPITWYAMMAKQRLEKLDPDLLAKVATDLRTRPRGTSIVRESAALLRSKELACAVELLRLGLTSYARAEIRHRAPKGQRGDWLLAYIFDRVGDHTAAYKIARWKRPDHMDDFPIGDNLERWRIGNPRPKRYRKAVTTAAKKNGVDEALIWAIMQTESAFRPEVVSIANAVGLMQLIIPTGRAMAKREGVSGTVDRKRLQDPELNIRLGTHFLARLARRFEKNPALMAAGYNAGPGRPMKWLRVRSGEELDQFVENIPYRETRRYTKSVVTAWLRYHYLYGGEVDRTVALRLPRVE